MAWMRWNIIELNDIKVEVTSKYKTSIMRSLRFQSPLHWNSRDVIWSKMLKRVVM